MRKAAACILAGVLTVSSAFTWGTEVRATAGVPYNPTPVLGIAGNFNAFIFDDFTQDNDQIEGRLAAGGNITLSGGYGVARAYRNSSATDVLVAGKKFKHSGSGEIYGNVVYGDTIEANEPIVNIIGAKKQGSPIDFPAEKQYLISRSAAYGALSATKEIGNNNYGTLTISAPDLFNVVHLDAATLANTNNIQFNIAQNATLIINISGATVNVPSFAMNNGKAGQVLFNFYEATKVNIAYTTFWGRYWRLRRMSIIPVQSYTER